MGGEAEVDRIEKRIELNAPLARVWRALTDHEEFGAWFRVRLDGPFVVGAVSTGWITYPGYEHLKWKATVRALEPESRFAFTWSQAEDPDAEDAADLETLVEFRLEPTPSGTRLTITESGFERIPLPGRLEMYRRNDGGWTEQVTNIRTHVEA